MKLDVLKLVAAAFFCSLVSSPAYTTTPIAHVELRSADPRSTMLLPLSGTLYSLPFCV